jgi:hypothetical protein
MSVSQQGDMAIILIRITRFLLPSLSPTDRHFACCPSNYCYRDSFINWNGKYRLVSSGARALADCRVINRHLIGLVRGRTGTECFEQE